MGRFALGKVVCITEVNDLMANEDELSRFAGKCRERYRKM